MKNALRLMAALTVLAVAMIFSGCVLTSDNAVIEPSPSAKVPDISGAFTNNNNETYTLNLISGTANSFTATAPDKSQLVVTLEPLKGEGRFLAQVKNPDEATVLLTICTLKPGLITVYDFKPGADLKSMAAKHGVTIDEGGHIVKYKSKKGLLNFFAACFSDKYSRVVTTIGARPSEAR